jgi:hypothetical protein
MGELLLDDLADFADHEAVPGWSVSCLSVWLSAGAFMGTVDVAGRLEGPVIASGPVRPSSAGQPSMWGQSRWPSCSSPWLAMSARSIAVMALLRSKTS